MEQAGGLSAVVTLFGQGENGLQHVVLFVKQALSLLGQLDQESEDALGLVADGGLGRLVNHHLHALLSLFLFFFLSFLLRFFLLLFLVRVWPATDHELPAQIEGQVLGSGAELQVEHVDGAWGRSTVLAGLAHDHLLALALAAMRTTAGGGAPLQGQQQEVQGLVEEHLRRLAVLVTARGRRCGLG